MSVASSTTKQQTIVCVYLALWSWVYAFYVDMSHRLRSHTIAYSKWDRSPIYRLNHNTHITLKRIHVIVLFVLILVTLFINWNQTWVVESRQQSSRAVETRPNWKWIVHIGIARQTDTRTLIVVVKVNKMKWFVRHTTPTPQRQINQRLDRETISAKRNCARYYKAIYIRKEIDKMDISTLSISLGFASYTQWKYISRESVPMMVVVMGHAITNGILWALFIFHAWASGYFLWIVLWPRTEPFKQWKKAEILEPMTV